MIAQKFNHLRRQLADPPNLNLALSLGFAAQLAQLSDVDPVAVAGVGFGGVISLLGGCWLQGLRFGADKAQVCGLRFETEGQSHELQADLPVDGGGHGSGMLGWLAAEVRCTAAQRLNGDSPGLPPPGQAPACRRRLL